MKQFVLQQAALYARWAQVELDVSDENEKCSQQACPEWATGERAEWLSEEWTRPQQHQARVEHGMANGWVHEALD